MASAIEGCCRMTHTAHALIVIFFFHDSWELLFVIGLDKVHYHVNADLLIHDRETSLVLVACLDQCWEQDVLKTLVVKVGNRKCTKFLDYCTLSFAKEGLVLFVIEAEVTNH